SAETVVALLGILKAGGAYVPLDPEYPAERLASMAGTAGADLVLTLSRLRDRLPAGTRAWCLDEPTPIDERPPLGAGAGGDGLAYVMFTSGSTGQPKGIEVSHRNVVRLVRNGDCCEMGEAEVYLHFAPLAFDASTLELWAPLLNGGRLVV